MKVYEKAIYVRCVFRAAGMPHERIFTITANGVSHSGVAQDHYCRDAVSKGLLGEIAKDVAVGGVLVGLQIEKGDGKSVVRVLLPDNEVYDLPVELIVTVPETVREHHQYMTGTVGA